MANDVVTAYATVLNNPIARGVNFMEMFCPRRSLSVTRLKCTREEVASG